VIKDRDYFLSLDLGCVPEPVRSDPTIRATDELWGYLLTAIWYRSQAAPVPTDALIAAVGEPDSVVALNTNDEAWSYNWLGYHGPDQYSSATPFRVRDCAVIGIVDSDGDA